MQVLLVPNFARENVPESTDRVVDRLNQFGIEALMDSGYAKFFAGRKVAFLPFPEAMAACDALIAIGGDGTILQTAKHAVAYDKPLLGINVGRLGFMAGLEMGELDLLKKLRDGTYSEEKRMMLDCVHSFPDGEKTYLALNDVVISNGSLSRVIELSIWSDQKELLSYRADGIILSTPTGSTAYALSAGGPIVEPSVHSIVLTPICPHSLFNRSILFSEENVIHVTPKKSSQTPAYITIDGCEGIRFGLEDSITVRCSRKVTRLIRLKDRSFYEVLRQKFKIYSDRNTPLEESL